MWPPACLFERRAYSSEIPRSMMQKDFCNNIGPSRHSATRQNLVAIGGIADIERFSAGNDLQRLTLNVDLPPSVDALRKIHSFLKRRFSLT
jgi:hypothetical protein